MIIDAKDAILGRLSTYAAKQLLLGKKVDVVNCEESVLSGKRGAVIAEYIRRLHMKAPRKGPYFYRKPDLFVKRTIRGMLPFKRSRGREAFKNIKCHVGIPENLKNEKALVLENAHSNRLHSVDCIKVKDICRSVGWK